MGHHLGNTVVPSPRPRTEDQVLAFDVTVIAGAPWLFAETP